jgi:hypothetical protein
VRFVVVLANEDNPAGSEDSSSEGRKPDGLPRGTRGGEGRGGRRVETTTDGSSAPEGVIRQDIPDASLKTSRTSEVSWRG